MKNAEKWGRVGKSGVMVEKVRKSDGKWRKVAKIGEKKLFFDKMGSGGHFGLDDNVSYRTRPRYLDEQCMCQV